MQRLTICLFAVTLLVPITSLAESETEEKIFSGPQPGEQITPFRVLSIISPTDVKEVSVVEAKHKGPTFVVFLHKVTEPAIGLIMSLEWYASKQKDLEGHYVILTEDRSKTEAMVKRWSRGPFLAKSSFSISMDGLEGPGRYGLNRDVAMTLLIAKDNTVQSNFVLRAPNGTDAPEILKALAKTLGEPAPSMDKIRAELRAERDRRRQKRIAENPIYKLAPNAELGRLMVRMQYGEGNNAARVKRTAEQLEKWAGKEEKKCEMLRKYSQAVLDSDNIRLTEASRKELKRLANE